MWNASNINNAPIIEVSESSRWRVIVPAVHCTNEIGLNYRNDIPFHEMDMKACDTAELFKHEILFRLMRNSSFNLKEE